MNSFYLILFFFNAEAHNTRNPHLALEARGGV